MRVLFVTSEWSGHYFCMVPLGWALQAAGHEVRVTCKPSQVGVLSRAGLVPVPVGDGPDLALLARVVHHTEVSMGLRPQCGPVLNPFTNRVLGEVGEPDVAVEGPKFFREAAVAVRRGCDNVVAFAGEWGPDLVLYDVMAAEGALAARVRGVPSVLCGPGLFGVVETERALDMGPADPVEHFDRYGVGSWGRRDIEYFIDPSPEGAVPPLGGALRLPVRFVPYNGPVTVYPRMLPVRGGLRICVLWGNSATQMFGTGVPGLRYALEAAADFADDVVFLAGEEQVDALKPFPAHVRSLPNFPLHLPLSSSDLLIDHCSDNPVMNGALAGVPRLGLALSGDHFVFGRRIDPLGASRTLPALTASREEVRQAVGEILDGGSYRAAAAQVRSGVLAQPAPSRLVPVLERLAAGGSLGCVDLSYVQPTPYG
ncbi:nucleotide disphospho-sugar-binding domain-containing protein [Streptomyces sp. NPDC059176]|uniref:nucleotide disphospho-sugar-binding domain-containing protein n=1 Tax=Streptomyces sp. NPDC059176 TaxID=3346758 RepID=UPI00367CE878